MICPGTASPAAAAAAQCCNSDTWWQRRNLFETQPKAFSRSSGSLGTRPCVAYMPTILASTCWFKWNAAPLFQIEEINTLDIVLNNYLWSILTFFRFFLMIVQKQFQHQCFAFYLPYFFFYRKQTVCVIFALITPPYLLSLVIYCAIKLPNSFFSFFLCSVGSTAKEYVSNDKWDQIFIWARAS